LVSSNLHLLGGHKSTHQPIFLSHRHSDLILRRSTAEERSYTAIVQQHESILMREFAVEVATFAAMVAQRGFRASL
jgi:hypothetical protein